MTPLKKDAPPSEGGAKAQDFQDFTCFWGCVPKIWPISVPKWGVIPFPRERFEFFQWSHYIISEGTGLDTPIALEKRTDCLNRIMGRIKIVHGKVDISQNVGFCIGEKIA